MLAQLPGSQYTHINPQKFTQQRVRFSSVVSSSSSSTAAAVRRRSSNVAAYAAGLGSLVKSRRINEAVGVLEDLLDKRRRPHGLATGDLLEGECVVQLAPAQ